MSLYNTHIETILRRNSDLLGYYTMNADNTRPTSPVSFKQFIRGGKMHYAYKTQRIFISNEQYPISYVFGLKDRLWTVLPLCITSSVNSYPNALAMQRQQIGLTIKNALIDLADIGDSSAVRMPSDGFILTRPLKLGSPDILKTIRFIQVRGQFVEQSRICQPASGHHIDMVIYGTNDTSLSRWLLVGSCKGPRYVGHYGSPFKFFRVAIITHLDKGESIDSIEIEYETKETNKER